MLSIKRLLPVMGVIIALTVLAPGASAASHKAFHLEKACSSDYLCTVLWSNFDAFPQGTHINYTDTPTSGVFAASIAVSGGSTTGLCDWNHPTGPIQARCTFDTGTGTLTGFHLAVRVTANANGSVWYWDGTYWFGS
jgi:hypothetical protein